MESPVPLRMRMAHYHDGQALSPNPRKPDVRAPYVFWRSCVFSCFCVANLFSLAHLALAEGTYVPVEEVYRLKNEWQKEKLSDHTVDSKYEMCSREWETIGKFSSQTEELRKERFPFPALDGSTIEFDENTDNSHKYFKENPKYTKIKGSFTIPDYQKAIYQCVARIERSTNIDILFFLDPGRSLRPFVDIDFPWVYGDKTLDLQFRLEWGFDKGDVEAPATQPNNVDFQQSRVPRGLRELAGWLHTQVVSTTTGMIKPTPLDIMKVFVYVDDLQNVQMKLLVFPYNRPSVPLFTYTKWYNIDKDDEGRQVLNPIRDSLTFVDENHSRPFEKRSTNRWKLNFEAQRQYVGFRNVHMRSERYVMQLRDDLNHDQPKPRYTWSKKRVWDHRHSVNPGPPFVTKTFEALVFGQESESTLEKAPDGNLAESNEDGKPGTRLLAINRGYVPWFSKGDSRESTERILVLANKQKLRIYDRVEDIEKSIINFYLPGDDDDRFLKYSLHWIGVALSNSPVLSWGFNKIPLGECAHFGVRKQITEFGGLNEKKLTHTTRYGVIQTDEDKYTASVLSKGRIYREVYQRNAPAEYSSNFSFTSNDSAPDAYSPFLEGAECFCRSRYFSGNTSQNPVECMKNMLSFEKDWRSDDDLIQNDHFRLMGIWSDELIKAPVRSEEDISDGKLKGQGDISDKGSRSLLSWLAGGMCKWIRTPPANDRLYSPAERRSVDEPPKKKQATSEEDEMDISVGETAAASGKVHHSAFLLAGAATTTFIIFIIAELLRLSLARRKRIVQGWKRDSLLKEKKVGEQKLSYCRS